MFDKSHIYPVRGKFLPLIPIWPESHLVGITDGTGWEDSAQEPQQFRNPKKSVEKYVEYFRTCKVFSTGQSDHRSVLFWEKGTCKGRQDVRISEKLQNEVAVCSFLQCCLDHIESKTRKWDRMVILASHPDGRPPTGGVDYRRKNDLFCTRDCQIVSKCVKKAADYSNIFGCILVLPLPLPWRSKSIT